MGWWAHQVLEQCPCTEALHFSPTYWPMHSFHLTVSEFWVFYNKWGIANKMLFRVLWVFLENSQTWGRGSGTLQLCCEVGQNVDVGTGVGLAFTLMECEYYLRVLLSGLNWLVGHPVGVHRQLEFVGVRTKICLSKSYSKIYKKHKIKKKSSKYIYKLIRKQKSVDSIKKNSKSYLFLTQQNTET